MDRLVHAFVGCEKLQEHMRFLLAKGGLYKVYNNNLLYHVAGVIQHRTVCAEDAAVGGVLQAHLCPLLAVSIQALQVGLSTAVILEVGHDHIRIAGAQVLGDLVEVLAVPAALQEVQSGI